MGNSRTKNVVLIIIWTLIGAAAAWFLFTSVATGSFSFEPKHVGEPTVVLSDTTLDESITSVTINWISGGVKIIPTTGNKIRIVEKAYQDVAESKWLTMATSGQALSIQSKNKPLFNFLGLMTRSTYLEIYLPLSVEYSLIKVNGVSGNYEIEGLNTALTQITLTSGNLTIKDTFAFSLSLTMTSGQATFASSEFVSSNIKITSGKLNYDAITTSFNATMTSGMADITFEDENPNTMNLSMTSGLANITLNGPEAFSVKVEKTSGSFDPNFDYTQNGKVYSYLSGGPQYTISMTSGSVDFKLNP